MWKFRGNLTGSTQWRKPMQLWRMDCQTINIYTVNAYACVETKCFQPCEQSSKPVLCTFQCRKYLSKFYVYEWMFRQELPRSTKEVMRSCFSLQQGTCIQFLSPDYCSFIYIFLFLFFGWSTRDMFCTYFCICDYVLHNVWGFFVHFLYSSTEGFTCTFHRSV